MIGAIISSAAAIILAFAGYALRMEHRLTRIETLIMNGGKLPNKSKRRCPKGAPEVTLKPGQFPPTKGYR